jgi:hypothetical protein
MATLENLKGFERLFDMFDRAGNQKLIFKSIQLGHMQNQLNKSALTRSPNYKAIYNRILRNHFSNQQKLKMLRAVENETNAERVRLALKAVDKNLLNRNSAYNNAYNRVLNKHGMSRVKTRTQQGGTCWFHSIINGLLMSPRPRRLLKQMVANVAPINGSACPSKTASRELFLRYIKHRLEGPGTVNNVFKNVNVIRSAGLRGLGRPGSARYSIASVYNSVAGGGRANGGTVGDFKWFYRKMFPGSTFIIQKYGDTASRYIGRTNPAVPHFITKNGVKYELTHAFIFFWVKPVSGHVITGYKSAAGNFEAFDSAFNTKVPNYDWTKPARIAGPSLMWEKVGCKTGGMNIHAVYMIVPPRAT